MERKNVPMVTLSEEPMSKPSVLKAKPEVVPAVASMVMYANSTSKYEISLDINTNTRHEKVLPVQSSILKTWTGGFKIVICSIKELVSVVDVRNLSSCGAGTLRTDQDCELGRT